LNENKHDAYEKPDANGARYDFFLMQKFKIVYKLMRNSDFGFRPAIIHLSKVFLCALQRYAAITNQKSKVILPHFSTFPLSNDIL